MAEEISRDDENVQYNNTHKEDEISEEYSAKDILLDIVTSNFPQVKLEIFFRDIREGPTEEKSEIRENENRVLNNQKYGSQGTFESLIRENDVDCIVEKGFVYVRYTLAPKLKDNVPIQKNEIMCTSHNVHNHHDDDDDNNGIKNICKNFVDSKIKDQNKDKNKTNDISWDDNDTLCVVAVSGPESLVPGTPLYTYAEQPYEHFEYTEEARRVGVLAPYPPVPTSSCSSSCSSSSSSSSSSTTPSSSFFTSSLYGYMRLPLPMHSGWYVVSYVRTFIVGIKGNGNSDKKTNDAFHESENEDVNEENPSVKTAKRKIPLVITRKRVELGKSELFSTSVPVQGVGEDVLLPCNRGVRRRGVGFLGAPIWDEPDTFEKCDFSEKKVGDLRCNEDGIMNDDKDGNYDHDNTGSTGKIEGSSFPDTNTSFYHGIKDPRSIQIINSVPLGGVKMLDVTLEDLKNIKTLSVNISLPHVELNRKKVELENMNIVDNGGEAKNEPDVEGKKRIMADVENVDNDNQIEREEILCRAIIWAYDTIEEKDYTEINDTAKNKNNSCRNKSKNKNDNCENNSDDNGDNEKNKKIKNNDYNDNDYEMHDNSSNKNKNNNKKENVKGKMRRALRIVVEADVTTLLRNKGLVTVESVRTSYGVINIEENHIIKSILTNSLYTHNNYKSYLSSNNCRGIPLELAGSAGSINRYGQFVGRIFYGEVSNGNIRSKDTVTPYPNTERTSVSSISNNVLQVKSDTTITMNSNIKINENKNEIEKKNENGNENENKMNTHFDTDKNFDEKMCCDNNTDIEVNTVISESNTEIDISCGHCASSLVPSRSINKTLPMPTGDFDDVRDFIFCLFVCYL